MVMANPQKTDYRGASIWLDNRSIEVIAFSHLGPGKKVIFPGLEKSYEGKIRILVPTSLRIQFLKPDVRSQSYQKLLLHSLMVLYLKLDHNHTKVRS